MRGGWTGNLFKYWKAIAQGKIEEKAMEIYLAKEHPCKNGKYADWKGLNILETFYYLRNNKDFPRLFPLCQNFLLDSGAFTFMNNDKGHVDFDVYTEEYAKFINKYDIKQFFELDIDSVVGLKEVERLRSKLISFTGKKPIPVWHISRGKAYFIRMCEEFSYVAIGGIVTKEIPTKKYEKLFPWFIKTAHLHKAKIHGLGYTNIKGLHKFRFDSVDSTAWLYGNMSGTVYNFNPRKGEFINIKAPNGKKLVSHAVAVHNFNEWVRFQKYARALL